MGYGLKVMMSSLCIISIIAFKVFAQDNPPSEDPYSAQIKRVNKDIRSLNEQVDPLKKMLKKLTIQVKSIKAELIPLENQIKDDRHQLKALRKQRRDYQVMNKQAVTTNDTTSGGTN